MTKSGRQGKGPGGPSRPSRSGRATLPSSTGGPGGPVTIKNPSIDGLVESILRMARQVAPAGAPGRAIGMELWADHLAVSLYDPEAMPAAYYEELADGLVASTDPDAPAVLAALATALSHDEAGPLRATHTGAASHTGAAGDDDLGIGRATPTRAWVVEEGQDDGLTVVVEFDQPGAPHSLTAFIDHSLEGLATDLSVGPPWGADGDGAEVGAEPDATVTEVSLADARARIEHAVDRTAESPGAPVSDDYLSLGRLAMRRLALLPR